MMVAKGSEAAFVFPINYDRLSVDWAHPRAFLGVTDNKLATLKALRRTAARNLTINGNAAGRVFDISANDTLSGMTITGGNDTGVLGGGIYVHNNAALTLNDVALTGNYADYAGAVEVDPG